MDSYRYISSSAEMKLFLDGQRKEMCDAMATIRKATKAGIPLQDTWTAEQILEKPPAIAAHGCNTVNDKIVWHKDTRVPVVPHFTTVSAAFQSGVPMHMVKHSDARMAATLIPQEDYDSALEGPVDQFVPLRRLPNGLVPFVGLQILKALPFKLDLDEEFYDMCPRREIQRQTLKSALHGLKADGNTKTKDPFFQTVADIFGPRARLGPFLDAKVIEASTPAIYTTHPTSHSTYLPSERSIDTIAELGYDRHSEGALLCRLTDDEQNNARWMGVNVLFSLPFKVHIHPAVHKAFQNGSLKLPAEFFDQRSERILATSAQDEADFFAHTSAPKLQKSFFETDAAEESQATSPHDLTSVKPMSEQMEEAEAVEHQESIHESTQDQSSPQAEQKNSVSSSTEHLEAQPVAGDKNGEFEETASTDAALTQAAAPAQPANTTTSKCMLPNCPRPMNRAEVRRTHLVTHYAKWHGMPAVQRVYGGNWSASNDAQDAIIVPWLRGLGIDPASIKLDGEVIFKG
ncbi:hypothetical protein KC367_g5115 [Hortaea werneckii]|nr:hypothetical protein KC342_g2626 [Hortaea werneckii]KAI7104260.1 hypothetical protein KC339_g4661 [Hortaea werneckii]KAI7323854.1 hypothetical protein KC340_g6589 [Hortaea werneckii]KAI7403530.1 hypothetical protein KC328_g2315 [Hortaea werneckii]KAI7489445.1 hypothetical protein KC351_g1315 [Hortaea werneckii]